VSTTDRARCSTLEGRPRRSILVIPRAEKRSYRLVDGERAGAGRCSTIKAFAICYIDAARRGCRDAAHRRREDVRVRPRARLECLLINRTDAGGGFFRPSPRRFWPVDASFVRMKRPRAIVPEAKARWTPIGATNSRSDPGGQDRRRSRRSDDARHALRLGHTEAICTKNEDARQRAGGPRSMRRAWWSMLRPGFHDGGELGPRRAEIESRPAAALRGPMGLEALTDEVAKSKGTAKRVIDAKAAAASAGSTNEFEVILAAKKRRRRIEKRTRTSRARSVQVLEGALARQRDSKVDDVEGRDAGRPRIRSSHSGPSLTVSLRTSRREERATGGRRDASAIHACGCRDRSGRRQV